MRSNLRSAIGLATVGLLSLSITQAPAQVAPRAERELLQIRIWNKFSDVLTHYGQPTRIENGLINHEGSAATAQAGAAGGSAPSMGMGGGGMMGGMMGKGGMSGGGGGRMGGMMMGMSGGGGGRGAGRMGGMSGGGSAMSGSVLSPDNMAGGGGAPGGFGAPAGGVTGNADVANEARSTWIYEKGLTTNYFVFNKDGRIIQIESASALGILGRIPGGLTSRGITLGDSISKVYQAYGWAKLARGGSSPVLDYTRDYHVAFAFTEVPGKGPVVTGITVTLLDLATNGINAASAAAGGMAGGMGGGPTMGGMGGMMGMSGGGMMGGKGGMMRGSGGGAPMAGGSLMPGGIK